MKKLTKLFAVLALVLCTVFAVACTPNDVGGAVEKLAKEGYDLKVYYNKANGYFSEEDIDDLDLKGDFYYVFALKETSSSYKSVALVIFEKTSDAKKTMEEYEEDLEKIADRYDIDVIERKGKVIILANKGGYKDFTE